MRKLRVKLAPAIRQLEVVTRGMVSTRLIGQYKSVFKGKGLEFASYRAYAPDDDASLIDWKASRRANQLLVKQFVEERNLEVFFLIDTSASMVFGSTEKLKNEYVAELVASLAYVILESGDSVGFALFNRDVLAKSPPLRGKKQFYQLTSKILDAANYGDIYDLEGALRFIITYLPEGTVVMMVTDFIGLRGDWERYLKIAAKKFDLITIMVRDPRDRTMPYINRQILVQDPFSRRQMIINPIQLKGRYEDYVLKQEAQIRQKFTQAGAAFIELSTDKPFGPPIIGFFKRRQMGR